MQISLTTDGKLCAPTAQFTEKEVAGGGGGDGGRDKYVDT